MADNEIGSGRTGSTYSPLRDQPVQPADVSAAEPGASLYEGDSSSTAQSDGEKNARQASTSDLRQMARDDVASVRHAAEDGMSKVSAAASQAADQQKTYAADRVAGVANAIERVGSELEGDEPELGRMTRQMGESVQRFAEDIKGRDLGEIAGMAEDFGRRQPLAFLGIAAIAGLAASRFIGASAHRQTAMTSRAGSGQTGRAAPVAPSAPPKATSPSMTSTSSPVGGSNV
ncbi:ElaB/YqjD/DUF883 family membrane-anchored ribosome-binding protein [Neorhizobium galegae]|uniref:nutrient deprivation-induced protein n=1 Tax=Neorhizobium galegae TaxID=399 RepID=UPI001AE66C8E|nr:nutrient deprivation-induced protein [Neorhizobium galegae]MBP2548416.1 ElaB/YqjD/DUF883 family membrane-anchored ribosome-binding protein [Neorhizobium galegae]